MTKLRLLNRMLAGIFFLILFQFARAQSRVVTGTVLDDKGGVLAGATVRVKGSEKGVNTDAAGRFSISVPGSASVLVVSYVGFEAQEIALRGNTDVRVGRSEG